MWPDNYWKYNEVVYYFELAQWAISGIDMNRIDGLTPEDFKKTHIVRKYLDV